MSSILTQVVEKVGCIILNRPDKFNSFNREMAFTMQAALDAFANDSNIRCIHITGNGKAFCAGQDLGELVGENAPTLAQILSEHYNPIVTRLRETAKPIVCAVNGVAAGAGANIALAADVVVASETASFIQAFSKIGLVPDSGGTFTLPRLIGFNRASAYMMLGDKIAATDALQMGMLYKVFSQESLQNESLTIAHTLSNMPTKALAFTKHILNQSLTNTFQQQLQIEDEYQQKAALTKDYAEGVAAFLEKRHPNFVGE